MSCLDDFYGFYDLLLTVYHLGFDQSTSRRMNDLTNERIDFD
ncbi:MAG: hypothetical protein V3W52_16585 [Syntrophobacteria bacterium]|jgi:hypothetical protein